jgi:hypothetical protein
MKKIFSFIIIIGVVLGIFYFLNKKEAVAPVVNTPVEKNTKSKIDVEQGEFCFAKFGIPNNNGYYDRYTLRLILSGEQATGELNLLPVEKDLKTGEIKGTVGIFDKVTMTRVAILEWFTFTGGTDTEKVTIVFGENMASIKQGTSTLSLTGLPCLDLIERTNVENYLNDNISELSPVKAVLGGNWYVLYATINLEKNSGTVVYEDGHIQEKRNFLYTTNKNGEVLSLIIK